MSSKQLILAFLLMITFFENNSENPLKYDICGKDMHPIDSSIRLFETNLVYLISDDIVYELQLKKGNQTKIEDMYSVHDWSEDIETPIDMILGHTTDTKLISLVNCKTGTEWSVEYDTGKFKGSKKYECGNDFEFLMGRTADQILGVEPMKYSLEYLEDNKEIRDRLSYHLLRSNDSSDNPIKFIKWVYDSSSTPEISTTYPFSTMNGHRIKAAFIYDEYWFLSGGQYFCRVKLNEKTFSECKPILISDWISNCNEVEEGEVVPQVGQSTKKGFSGQFIILLVVIVVAIFIVLIIVFLIFREVSKKGSSTNKKTSSSH